MLVRDLILSKPSKESSFKIGKHKYNYGTRDPCVCNFFKGCNEDGEH